MSVHPVIADLREMVRGAIPRLRDGGQAMDLALEPEAASDDLFDILFVRLLAPPGKTRSVSGLQVLREAAFEVRIFYSPSGRPEETSSKALADGESLLALLPDDARLPSGTSLQHVRALSAQIERRSAEKWILHVDVDAFYRDA